MNQDRKSRITIAPLRLTDAELVSGILAASAVKPAWSAHAVATFLAQPGVQGFIACYGDEPAGALLYRLVLSEAEILTLGVAEGLRRRGIAQALMGQALTQIVAAGGQEIFLEVAVNNKAAENLYKNLGFVSISTRHNYYQVNDYFINAEVLWKSLIKKQ